METNKQTWLLWVLAIVAVVLAVITWPSHKQLTAEQTELATVNRKIKNVKRDARRQSAVNQSFDTLKAERTATTKLQETLALGFGGIHSDDDFKANESKMIKVLGTNFVKRIMDMNDGDSAWGVYQANKQVTISFEKANSKHVVPVIATVTATTATNKEDNELIKMNYDLKKQEVLSYSITKPTSKVQTVTRGD